MRLIHWRSSARWGELQVRELETITGGEEIIICLDNSSNWEANLFEEAVKATASIYFYGSKQQLPINLWIANMGVVHGSQVILETLAGVNSGEMMTAKIPDTPVVWLSNNSESFSLLPKGSHYFLFAENANAKALSSTSMSGIYYDPNSSLVNQLQKPLANFS